MTKPVPRIRKQKARRRALDHKVSAPETDSNALEILPADAAEHETRKRKLLENLEAQRSEDSRMSSKKKKRLDKYIDNKLKKEKDLDLIKKLAAQKIDTSLLKSSKRLGSGNENRKEQLGRILREKRAGLNVGKQEALLWDNKEQEDTVSDGSLDEDGDISKPYMMSRSVDTKTELNAPASLPGFGSGLKRPLEVDHAGNPVIQKRKRAKVQKSGWQVPSAIVPTGDDEYSDWEGLDSGSEAGGTPVDGAALDEPSHEVADLRSVLSSNSHSSDSKAYWSDASTGEDQDSEPEKGENDDGLRQERASAFKSWASQLRNEAIGFTPSNNISNSNNPMEPSDKPANSRSRNTVALPSNSAALAIDPQPAQSSPNADQTETMVAPPGPVRKIFNVPVKRTPDLEESRRALPVTAEEQKIMEAIHGCDTVIIWGATGSGKTTQLPQFLFEAGYGDAKSPNPGMIGVTQPRRVAAVSMSRRVTDELGDQGDKVAYQIRYDSTVSTKTAIKFMTDGVLIREISQDFTLSKYSAIIIDEAHERSINTDLLIGMMSRIVETRADLSSKTQNFKPLKLIIMSATLRTADLVDSKSLFRGPKPPVIQAEGRQYPVTVHFARRTQRDYLEETFQKIKRGHRKLPAGAILVFLTGQNEISSLAKRLKRELPSTDESGSVDRQVRLTATEASIEDEDMELDAFKSNQESAVAEEEEEGEGEDRSESETEITGLDNDEENAFDISDGPQELLKAHILPLYSQLPTEQQLKIFEPAPEGSRLIVLATNVAETSLTIPNVRYVFDCGRAKEKRYDEDTGVQTFDINWISKASASQRAGRAGRSGPGHCYRLYSSAVYERDFTEFATPEILRTPIEGVVLQLKSLGIPNVAKFPFPTPPDKTSFTKAEQLLEYLGAISQGKVTEMGKQLMVYPLSPRLSRIISMAQNYNVTHYALAVVAALAVGDLFVPESQLGISSEKQEDDDAMELDAQEKLQREKRRKEYNSFHSHLSRLDRNSDAMKLLAAVSDFSGPSPSSSAEQLHRYVRTKALRETQQLRQQLQTIAKTHNANVTSSLPLNRLPNPKATSMLNQVIAAGYIDQIVVRADLSPLPPQTGRKPKHASDVPYQTLFPSWPTNTQSIIAAQDDEKSKADTETRLKSVYIHPSSILAHLAPSKLPQFLIYSHLSRPSNTSAAETSLGLDPSVKIPKTRIHPLTPISGQQIVALASGTPLLEDGKPIGKIEILERDEKGRERRRVTCVPFLRPGKVSGEMGWPLPPARKVVQRRERGGGWVVESIES